MVLPPVWRVQEAVLPLRPKCPRSVFVNRDASPLVLISRRIAAYSVACGVFPPGLVQYPFADIASIIAFEVIGNDVTVSFAAEAGQLQLNAFEPIIAYSLFKSLRHMERACYVLADRCIDGIVANKDRLAHIVEHSLAIVTALNPYIGYENATRVALTAHETGKTIRQTVLDLHLMTEDRLDAALDVSKMLGPNR